MLTILNYIGSVLRKNRGFLLFVVFLFSIRWSFADHYRVPTGSMLPTIEIGDHVFVNKMAYDLRIPFTDIVLANTGMPTRGDIVVFEYPRDPSVNFVKRLIGLPGDEIEIINGLVKVNGKLSAKITEEELREFSRSSSFSYQAQLGGKEFTVNRIPQLFKHEHMKFSVPEDKFFFMGDNRDNSLDSRFWGFVDRGALKGKVTNVTISISFEEMLPDIKIARFGRNLI